MGVEDINSHVPVSMLLTPFLMAYYLCCWPGDTKSDTSSENQSNRRAAFGHDTGSHRRTSDFFSRRTGSSVASLHLPSTSGTKKEPLSAHRSHEEIGRRKSNHENREESTRYHSAPSVIDEVIHRRDWERSSRDLYIPLKPENEVHSMSSDSLEAPHAEPESSSIEEQKIDEQIVGRSCKKHHSNIKSSKPKEKTKVDEDKDCDATEMSNFYIGDNDTAARLANSPKKEVPQKFFYKPKEAKQSFNESVRSKERPKQTLVPLEEHQARMFGFSLDDVIDQLESLDRSGALHHTIESRISLSKPAYPPPSVEAVGYEGGACYLRAAEGGAALQDAGGAGGAGLTRARHASDGDILAPPLRPESGAFSESDVDFEVEGTDEHPPAYDEHQHYASTDKKETAI